MSLGRAWAVLGRGAGHGGGLRVQGDGDVREDTRESVTAGTGGRGMSARGRGSFPGTWTFQLAVIYRFSRWLCAYHMNKLNPPCHLRFSLGLE